MDEIKYAELFAGVGGFRLGLERANKPEDIGAGGRQGQPVGHNQRRMWDYPVESDERQATFRCVWANEIDRHACKVYREHFGDKELVEGDIRDIPADKIPEIDLLSAGFPCQTHSVAGKRKGIDDSRGTLFAQIVRVASAKRPRLLLLENVRGLLSSNDGRAFAVILRVLGNLGYLLSWQSFNSKYFGLPQNRERVFIIGHLGEGCAEKIFPFGQDGRVPEEERGGTLPTLTANDWKGPSKQRATILVKVGDIWEGSQCRVYADDGIAPTLHKSGGSTEPVIANALGIRRLMPIECERLQGFPDRWTESLSDTQRYKVLGNAVSVPVVEFLGRQLALHV